MTMTVPRKSELSEVKKLTLCIYYICLPKKKSTCNGEIGTNIEAYIK